VKVVISAEVESRDKNTQFTRRQRTMLVPSVGGSAYTGNSFATSNGERRSCSCCLPSDV